MGDKMKDAKIIYEKPENLIPYKNNHKRHSDDQVLRVASSIQEFSFLQPIVIDKNKVVISGHARLAASLKLKLKEVPVIIADHLTENQVKAARIADNKSSSTEYDNDALKFELGYLSTQDFNLNLTGITPLELDLLMKDNVIDDSFQKSVIGDFQNTGENAPNPIVYNETEMPVLTNDPKSDFENITFILHKDQMLELKEALKLSKEQGDFEGELNENSNGNALARIAKHFIEAIG